MLKPLKPEDSRSSFMFQDGTSNPNAAVNGSIVSVDMIFRPPSNEAWIMDELSVQILTNSIQIDDVKFGDITALDNGISAKIINDIETILDYTELENIKSNNDLAALGFETTRSEYDTKPKGLTGIVNFAGRHQSGVLLDGAKNERFVVTINDNLTGLIQILLFINATLST